MIRVLFFPQSFFLCKGVSRLLHWKDDSMYRCHLLTSLCVLTVLKRECLSQEFLVKAILSFLWLDFFFLFFIVMEEAVYMLGLV